MQILDSSWLIMQKISAIIQQKGYSQFCNAKHLSRLQYNAALVKHEHTRFLSFQTWISFDSKAHVRWDVGRFMFNIYNVLKPDSFPQLLNSLRNDTSENDRHVHYWKAYMQFFYSVYVHVYFIPLLSDRKNHRNGLKIIQEVLCGDFFRVESPLGQQREYVIYWSKSSKYIRRSFIFIPVKTI